MMDKNGWYNVIIQIVLLVLAILCLNYYFVILGYCGRTASMIWLWPILSIIFGGLFLALFIDSKRPFINNIPKLPLAILGGLIVIGLLVFVFLYGCVLSGMNDKPTGKVDYLIVLGAQTKGTRPSRSLKFRLDGAIEYYKENNDTTIVVSGGQGPDEVDAEAHIMKNYLLEHGVPESVIIVEDQSTSTNENLKFSKALIEKEGNNINDCSVAICSNNFHMFRAKALARKIGYSNPQGLATKADGILIANYMIRDSLAILKEKMLGNI